MRVFRVFEAMLANMAAPGYSQPQSPCQAYECESLAQEIEDEASGATAKKESEEQAQKKAARASIERVLGEGSFGRICEALGQASACWSELSGAGVFQSTRAEQIAEQLGAVLAGKVASRLPRPTMAGEASPENRALLATQAAWDLIANAFDGDWTKASPEWREAAAKWRDENLGLAGPEKIPLLWPEAHHVDDPGGAPEQFTRIPAAPEHNAEGEGYRERMKLIAEWCGGTFEPEGILEGDCIRLRTGYEAKAGDVLVKRPSGKFVVHSPESFEKNYRPVE